MRLCCRWYIMPVTSRLKSVLISKVWTSILKAGLIENGLGDMDYHFKVIDREGREVYRCSDYSDVGSESSYSQPLFLNDPPARMSIVKIHFPGKKDISLIRSGL